MLFRQNSKGNLRQLPTNTLNKKILTADGADLKLDNKTIGRKGVCVDQEHPGYVKLTPVRELGRWCVSTRQKMSNRKTSLSAYWVDGKRKDVTADNMTVVLNFVAITLYYTSLKGIPDKRVDTH